MTNWPDNSGVFPLCEPFIKEAEGYSATPYLDSANIPTIGYGTIRYPNHSKVTMADPSIDEARATDYLESEMSDKANQIAAMMKRMPSLHQAAAMLSLTYNIGTGAFGQSTVLREFNAGNLSAAAEAFMLWDKARVNGVLTTIQGLYNRRVKEKALFLTADAPVAA